MGKKKEGSKNDAAPEAGASNSHSPSLGLPRSSSVPVSITPPEPDTATLWISRNKHWQYIASFQGKWCDMSAEHLEKLANLNYTAPRPSPVEPAFFFDIVKIRKLLDTAADQALRAATGTVANFQLPSYQRLHASQKGREIPLSAQRQLKMRETATENLAKAYRLDEIACSVAVMKSTSCMEEVASHVLKRQPQNPDALYVHYFHEKVPSRNVPQLTNLDPLNALLAHSPHPEVWRTRGVVKLLKDDDEGALEDFKRAISLDRSRGCHSHRTQQLITREQGDNNLKEDEQPSSLELRLVFHKAAAHLKIAVRSVDDALPPAKNNGTSQNSIPTEARPEGEPPEMPNAESEGQKKILEARKLVKEHARRALRGFMDFLSHFEYTPAFPLDYVLEIGGMRDRLLKGSKDPGRGLKPAPKYPIYKVHELFNASPIDLPPAQTNEQVAPTGQEILTYHPLLSEALHSLLLCHCLVQTSAKELHRHAYMVVRLARQCRGYNDVFQHPGTRVLARRDWAEVLRGCDNWIRVEGNWDDLLDTRLAEKMEMESFRKKAALLEAAASKLGIEDILPEPDEPPAAAGAEGNNTWTLPSIDGIDAHERKRIADLAAMGASGDDRITDAETWALAQRAHELRALKDAQGGKAIAGTAVATENGESGALVSTKDRGKAVNSDNGVANEAASAPQPRRSAFDVLAENYNIASDRASAVIRWVLEGPPHPGVQTSPDGAPKKTRKKKRLG